MSVIIIFFTSTNIFSENITNFLTNETGDRVLKYKIKIPVSNRTGVINFVFGEASFMKTSFQSYNVLSRNNRQEIQGQGFF